MSRLQRWKLIIGVTVIAALAVAFKFLPLNEWMQSALEWIDSMGTLAPVMLGLIYVAACVLFIPGSLLTLGAGYLFGVVVGTITVSLASTIGACAAFLVGRLLARKAIEEKVASNPKFQAIDEAVGKQGFKVVLLTRLSPVFPFNFLNYAFGVTKVSFRSYFLASWIGMLPGTVMYIYLGSAVKNISDLVSGKIEGGLLQNVLFGAGLLATIIVTIFVTRIARKALKQATGTETDQEKTPLELGEEKA